MLIFDVEQNSPEWYELHIGIPTASEFKNLITAKQLKPSEAGLKTYAITLAGEKFASKSLNPWEGNRYTEWGHEYEDRARHYYAVMNDVAVSHIGFATSDDKSVGCSPDSEVGKKGLLEIKCLQGQKHIESLQYIDQEICPPDFHIQTQGQLFVTGKEWVDLFFYHPDLPKVSIRIEPNPELQKLLATQLDRLKEMRDKIYEMLLKQDL